MNNCDERVNRNKNLFWPVVFFCSFLLLPAQYAHSKTYTTDDDVVGSVTHYKVKRGDTIYAIARQFDLGIVEVLAANPGIKKGQLKYDTILILPTMYVLPQAEHKGIVINLSELRLFYFPDTKTVMTFPLGIGRDGWPTPIGNTKVIMKRSNPSWIPPASIRKEDPKLPAIVPPGKNNPLGQYAITLAMPGIEIHGTNNPRSIGLRSSHGCMRMYPEDIEALFNVVDKGMPVTIIDKPYKLGWSGNSLFLQVTPAGQQSIAINPYRNPDQLKAQGIYDEIAIIAGTETGTDWSSVENSISEHSGIPVAIFIRPDSI